MIISVSGFLRTEVVTAGCQIVHVKFVDQVGGQVGMLEISMAQAEAIAKHLMENTIPSDHSRTGRELK